MIVGPAMPSPITPRCDGASARAVSSRKIAWWLYGAPAPPYSFGQVRPAYPAAPSLRLHSRSSSSKRRAPRFAAPSGRFCAMNVANLLPEGGLLGRVAEIHAFDPTG